MNTTTLTLDEISAAIHAINLYVDTPAHTWNLEDFNQWLKGQIG